MTTKKFKEIRRIHVDEVRQLCIDYGYYTLGTSEDYDHLLNDLCAIEKVIGTEQLQEIAEDIVSHSRFDDSLLLEEVYISAVMYDLANCCSFFFF